FVFFVFALAFDLTMDIASTIKFRDICKMFEQVKSQKNQQRKELVLKRYYESFQRHRQSFRQTCEEQNDQNQRTETNSVENGSSSFYSVLRLLLPSADTARDNYGLQITALGRLYTRVLQLAKDSRDAIRLQDRGWNSFRMGGRGGDDYAEVVHAVLLPRCHNPPSNLTLQEVHNMLDIIANEDMTVKETELIRFTDLASPLEQKWLIRILLKRLELGIGEQRIFGVLHANAKDMYQRCSDLGKVCNLLADNKLNVVNDSAATNTTAAAAPQINLNLVIEPFHHIRPMLCERFPGKIEELMSLDVLYMETKMDGERFQLHFARDHFKYISRNGADYTRNFGSSYDQADGTLTPHLRALLPLGMESIILDGEMMVWDVNRQCYRDKGENTDVKHLKLDGSWRPCYVVYDLLYLNGQSLLDLPFVQRMHKLNELIVEQPGVLRIMHGRKIGSIEQFHQYFQEALDSNAEGIVLKMQNSTYKPGVRVGGGWYKDKADYIKGLTTEFDVLIIGGFYNRKMTFIESFLLGVLQPQTNNSGRDEVFSIGRVANNTRQRVVLNDALRSHWHKASAEPPPLWFHYKATEKEGCPDVWIEPRHSIILQVKAADLAPYGAFYTAKSLHFPRTELVRDDKVWNECMTLQEFQQLCEGQIGIKKLNKRQLRLDDFTTERKRQKLTPAERSRLGLSAYEKRRCLPLEANTLLFDEFKFCILSGSPGRRQHKHQLRDLVLQNGGYIVENPLPHDAKCICIAGDVTYMVERLMQQFARKCEIVRMDWLLRCCEKQQIELRPKDVLAPTEPLRRQFAKSFDRFGDGYTESFATIQELQDALDDITDADLEQNGEDIGPEDYHDIEQSLEITNYYMFRDMVGYLSNNSDPMTRLWFLQHGGELVSDSTDRFLTHVFIDITQKLDNLEVLIQQLPPDVEVLNSTWLQQCHRESRLIPSIQFQVNYH
ncbi:LOW QUALITY PROTEIN: DNA ligase 4, partial [Drosophila tropicalis]|uniref:LOW QUALITY PROTEIN: DNA ligase 4 n=1 Tax=Drosophila tropicalis TaxID=46794 RepID=UPI0035AB6D09